MGVKVVIVQFPIREWNVADVWEISRDHGCSRKLVHTISRFFRVTDDAIIEEKAILESGVGYKPGEIVWIHSLIGKDFELQTAKTERDGPSEDS